MIRKPGKSRSFLFPGFLAISLVFTVRREDEIECIGYNYDGWERFAY
jgi:hypothetical protein